MVSPFFIVMNRIAFLSLILLWACGGSDRNLGDIQPYEGPIHTGEDVEVMYSEEGKKQIKLVTSKLLEFGSGDREFPEGIYMEFFDDNEKLSSTLRANYAYFFRNENKWKGTGDVQIENFENQQKLNTEELFWFPRDERIYTEKFVTIELEDEIIYGTGLVAKQDFSSYTIKDPEGEIYVED